MESFPNIEDKSLQEMILKFISIVHHTHKQPIILSFSNENGLKNIKDRYEKIYINLPDVSVRNEIVKKYAPHLSKEECESLVKELKGMTIKGIINIMEFSNKFWKEHYNGIDSGPPLKIYYEKLKR